MTEEQKTLLNVECGRWYVNKDDKRRIADVIIEWIRKNLSPDEVFTPTELRIFFEDHKNELENKLPVPETQY